MGQRLYRAPELCDLPMGSNFANLHSDGKGVLTFTAKE